MARFVAWRATVYDRSRVDPQDVVAPPYDVVGAAERAELAARSAYNSILVELPVDPSGGDKYQHAAAIWQEWHESGIVRVAGEPALYVYRMTFVEEDGTRRSTTGVLGALGLDPSHAGDVLPHEQTISKDKHDRLSLLRAARTNFSPIWGLSLAGGLGDLCEVAAKSAGDSWRATDEAGTVHECFAVDDSSLVEQVVALVATTPVLIADGHHRYETACAYYEETDGSPGSDAVLAYVVELSERELAVQAIHRLINGVDAGSLPEILERSFELRPGPSDPVELRNMMAAEGALGLLLPGGRAHLLTPRPDLLLPGEDELDSTRLARALANTPHAEVSYQHGAVEAARAVLEGRAEAAVLLRPVSVEQIRAVAHGGRRMPPKSTFFHPKPRTGMVFRELDAG